ncbi:MAG: GNAT family N-acetyltransferase [Prosthecobacter sp.]
MSAPPAIRLLKEGDASVLEGVAEGVFDHDIHPRWLAEFLADVRHHLAVAVLEGQVVGMASAVHYVHPDKAPELWINEVGVATEHQGRGIGKQLMEAMFAHGRVLGCGEAWVLTGQDNAAARGLYAAVGGKEQAALLVSFRL